MTPELKKRAQDNRFIFQSICNGCTPERVKEVYHLSDLELRNRTQMVLRKINDWRWARITNCVPGSGVGSPIVCETYGQFYENRKALMTVLDQLPDERIASDVFLPQVSVQNIDAQLLREVGPEIRHKMANAHFGASA